LAVTGGEDDWNFQDVDVRLRGRGNSTWWIGVDKRPLRIRFETPQPMFGSDYPHRDWILLANAFDNSMLRTHFAFYLAELLGNTGFVPTSQFVHLYVNEVYIGVYQFTDERDIGPGRGEVVTNPDPTVSEFWLEMDERTQDYFQVNGLWYDIRFPSGNALTDEHIAYANDFIERVSLAIRSHDWAAVTALVDIPSMVSYYILLELTKDADVAFSSMFMQIRGQGENRRLYQGPVWDFDMGFGNARSDYFFGDNPEGIWAAGQHYWFRELVQIPEFRALVFERWNEAMAHDIPRAIANVEYMATHYRAAFERNFKAQPVLGVRWGLAPAPHRYELETFVEHAEWLVWFIRERAAWLDDRFRNSDDPFTPPEGFHDVRANAWHREAVQFVVDNGLMTGASEVMFLPYQTLNRAMVATILWRLAGEPEAEWSSVFADVPQNAPNWYRTAVMWAETTGLISSEDGIFRPYATVPREEIAAIFYRYTWLVLEIDTTVPEDFTLDQFEDRDVITAGMEAYLLWANYNGILQGTSETTISPTGTVNRAQYATVLMRYVREFTERELSLSVLKHGA